MDKLFFSENGSDYSYGNLVRDLNRIEVCQYYVYYKDNNIYKTLTHILHSFIHDYNIEILDSDLSEIELQAMGVDPRKLSEHYRINDGKRISDIGEVIHSIIMNKNCSISLYTSGTTGKPKRVGHRLSTLIKNVSTLEKHSDDVWALAYCPTHIAGIQVFLQAVMNQNSIIYAFGQSQTKLDQLLREYQITHISATPTYYRNALTGLIGSYPQVERVTFGGEKHDRNLEKTMHNFFPNATFLNIYATTETGSLFTGSGEGFELNSRISPLVKINGKGEIFIHHSLLGEMDDHVNCSNWYATGDIVEMIGVNHFRIVSRSAEMINVGGYKANPDEIEKVLRVVPGIIDILIKGKSSIITGNIIVADVIKEQGVEDASLRKAIKEYANEHLQHWKVPRIINFVDRLTNSRSGKKLRR